MHLAPKADGAEARVSGDHATALNELRIVYSAIITTPATLTEVGNDRILIPNVMRCIAKIRAIFSARGRRHNREEARLTVVLAGAHWFAFVWQMRYVKRPARVQMP